MTLDIETLKTIVYQNKQTFFNFSIAACVFKPSMLMEIRLCEQWPRNRNFYFSSRKTNMKNDVRIWMWFKTNKLILPKIAVLIARFNQK